MASIIAPGIGSGLDINDLVTRLVAAEREPTTVRLDQREAQLQARLSGLGLLGGALAELESAGELLARSGTFTGRTAVSSDESRFTATATAGAAPGTFAIEVASLARAHKLASQGFTDSASEVGSGTLTVASGAGSAEIAVAQGTTLAGLRDAINAVAGQTGVSATIVNADDGSGGVEARLLLSAAGTGTANRITVTVDDDDGNDVDASGLSRFVFDPDGSGATQASELQAAADAKVVIDGLAVTRSSNTIGDAIDGVTLSLVAAGPGETATLKVAADRQGVVEAVQAFVDAYNALRGTIDALTRFEPGTGERGVLLGDAGLLSVSNLLSRELGRRVESDFPDLSTLSDVGVRFQADGTLALDEAVLDEALAEAPEAVERLFAGEGGVATRLAESLGTLLGPSGVLDARSDAMNARIEDIAAAREALEERLARLEQRLFAQFNAMDELVGRLQATSSFLERQLAGFASATGTGS